jgi:hypothetical protein
MTYCTHGITKAVAECINSKIMKIKRRAGGYRNVEYFKTAVLYSCGGLDLNPWLCLMDQLRLVDATSLRDRFPSVTARWIVECVFAWINWCWSDLWNQWWLLSIFSVSNGKFDDTPSRILHMSPNCQGTFDRLSHPWEFDSNPLKQTHVWNKR